MTIDTDICLSKRIRARRKPEAPRRAPFGPLPRTYRVTAPQNRWEDMHLTEVCLVPGDLLVDGFYVNIYASGWRHYWIRGERGLLDVTDDLKHVPLYGHWDALLEHQCFNIPCGPPPTTPTEAKDVVIRSLEDL